MKATELRIGNYVNEEYGGIYEVININSEVLDYVDLRKPTFKAIGRFDIYSIKPIPLTEELLLKCGFFTIETNGSINATMPKLRYELNKIKNSNIYLFCDKDVILIEIVYLHQLQNIFFALTNQELKIIL